MKENYGTTLYNNREYTLIQEAYAVGTQEDARYEALAICEEDQKDKEGYQTCYRIRFDILEGYEFSEPDENACDWDEASNVEESGKCNVEENIFI